MNKDYMFLKNFYTLLSSHYTVEESLIICKHILNHPAIPYMNNELQKGMDLENIILNAELPELFKEYFYFFKNKKCLSEAIEKSLDICTSLQNYQNQLKSKLTYPLILIVFLFLFSVFVVFILLPNVNQLFISFQIERTLWIQVAFILFYLIPFLIIVLGIAVVYLLTKLIIALKKKSFRIIEWYLKLPLFKVFLQKYFSLKFATYYQELLTEDMDSARIIKLLNEQMNHSDLKIVLYEMNNRLQEGETLEDILVDFEYLDPLFLSFFQMYMKNPTQHDSLIYYIQLTYDQIDLWIASFLKYLIPSIYSFVAVFVITIYISIIIPMMNIISEI